MNKVSILLPTYNEVENIETAIRAIGAQLQAQNWNYEIIVIDDDSPDLTAEKARSLMPEFPLKVLQRRTERGLSSAVVEGVKQSDGDFCVVMDSDGSHPVTALIPMLSLLANNQADIVVGSRLIAGGTIQNWPWYRQFTSSVASWLSIGLTPLTDPTSGFMAVRRESIQFSILNPTGWKIVLECVTKHPHLRLQEVPIVFADRQFGRSKMSAKAQWFFLLHLYHLYAFRYPTIGSFLKFSLVGSSGVLLDLAVVAFLHSLGLDIRLSAIVGFLLALSSNYFFNRYWSFAYAKNRNWVQGYLMFFGVCALGLIVRLGIMQGLMSIVSQHDLWINAVGLCGGSLVNFAGSRWLVFKAPHADA